MAFEPGSSILHIGTFEQTTLLTELRIFVKW